MPRIIVVVVSAAVLLSSSAAHATLPDPVTKAMRDVGVPVNSTSIYVREVGKIEPLVAHVNTRCVHWHSDVAHRVRYGVG